MTLFTYTFVEELAHRAAFDVAAAAKSGADLGLQPSERVRREVGRCEER